VFGDVVGEVGEWHVVFVEYASYAPRTGVYGDSASDCWLFVVVFAVRLMVPLCLWRKAVIHANVCLNCWTLISP
jgi:hypothetical protein